MQWWALQDPDDPKPYAVVCLDDQGLSRYYVPGKGLVDWPGMAMFTSNGEPGAHPISPDDAVALMKAGVGNPDPDPAQLGTAPTIQPDLN